MSSGLVRVRSLHISAATLRTLWMNWLWMITGRRWR
ncbi:hypothetical protein MHYP_G00049010 [Metynnis hypsauchen]